MFRKLGDFLSRWWLFVLAIWLIVFVALRVAAPPFDDLAKGGVFVFLPDYMESRQAETLFDQAFPGRQATSNMVIVVDREDASGITDADRSFITDTLKPALEKIRDRVNSSNRPKAGPEKDPTAPIITDIHTFDERGIGGLLLSQDKKASIVTVELALDFQDTRNWEIVRSVEDELNRLKQSGEMPKGLQLSLTGSATLGRDLSKAEADSARNTGPLTISLVVILLVVIYRAPLLAIVPLLTLFVAVDVSLHLLALLSKANYVHLFKGLQEYTTVITYGPGIDYCLFLIARYKENLEDCVPLKDSLPRAIGQVGSAIVASAATVICGIGMLTFAQFGKFHEAGIGITLTLIITLIATLTLTPSLLFMTGHWAFWPKPGVRCDDHQQRVTDDGQTAVQQNLFAPMWEFMGKVIEKRPLLTLSATVCAMLPLMILGVCTYSHVSYGLLESLPKTVASSVGAHDLEKHFPAGITGPIQILLQNSSVDFREEDSISMIDDLVERLMKRRDELKISDIRSVADPLGTAAAAAEDASNESFVARVAEKKTIMRHGVEHYVSSVAEIKGHITEMDIIATTNPFALESIQTLNRLTTVIQEELKDQLAKTKIWVVGPTASVRDVNTISQSDQKRIYLLVVSCVLIILVVLLRAIVVSIYLMITVLLSYLATLGTAWLLFYSFDPSGFIGLDWTVPLFLFVVLIAVGEDYNIFLVSRIHEEQIANGPTHGITIALSKTGGIITSCGVIMAGTFSSLWAGSLVRMQQLGFALAFGVLLDTFVIRPILVPAFLMLLNDKRYGNLARFLK